MTYLLNDMLCRMDLCAKPPRKRGYCDVHYNAMRRVGKLPKVKYPPRLRDGWKPDREGLAWAAGLVDGEGSFYVTNSATTRSGKLCHLDVGQSSRTEEPPEVLLRFQSIVGFGRLDGPRIYPDHRLDAYKLQYNGFQQVQAVFAMLWPNLGPVKRAQAIVAMRTSRGA